MNCKFDNSDKACAPGRKGVRCARCGLSLCIPSDGVPDRIVANCKKPGLGDRVAFVLVAFFGISKERVAEYLRRMRISDSGSCGCEERQESINELGWRFEKVYRKIMSSITKTPLQ